MASRAQKLRFEAVSADEQALGRHERQIGLLRRHRGEMADQMDEADRGLLHLGELVPRLRERLAIRDDLTDAVILDSLVSIVERSEPRARWLTAFNSPLGHWLVVHGCDLNTALSFTLSLLPQPRS